jgi:hypothetical protein
MFNLEYFTRFWSPEPVVLDRESDPVQFPAEWHCLGCDVWGSGMACVSCWSCGGKDLEWRPQPRFGGHSYRRGDDRPEGDPSWQEILDEAVPHVSP